MYMYIYIYVYIYMYFYIYIYIYLFTPPSPPTHAYVNIFVHTVSVVLPVRECPTMAIFRSHFGSFEWDTVCKIM